MHEQQLNHRERERYSRQMILPEVGSHGQEKLKRARVLIIGVGGLGIPAAQYLTAAGIGTIGLIDDDSIDVSNLHRQILYGESLIGKQKIDGAFERLHDLNPHTHFTLYRERLTNKNALGICMNYDLIIDGSDNFETRYLVNDAAILSKLPVVYGSIFKFEGQVSIFGATDGPCYRCLFPNPPASETVPSCAESGVLGALPGIIGSLQASEALKLILGIGDPLVGRLYLLDTLSMRSQEIRFKRNRDCPLCGDHPSIKELQDYEAFCQGKSITGKKHSITVEDFSLMRKKNESHFLLDVREPYEYDIANIGGNLIPMNELPSRLDELPRDIPIVIMCHVGIRSLRIEKYLETIGFDNVLNLTGGIAAWSKKVDSSIPVY